MTDNPARRRLSVGDAVVFLHQLLLGLLMIGILGDAVHGADLDALGFIIVADTLGAEIRVDNIDLIPLADGAIGTFGFTDIAVDAFIGNNQSHFDTPARIGLVRGIISCIHYDRIKELVV
jgi:hypothetical protein